MIAAGVAIVGSYIIDRKVSPMLLFSTILIFIFGALTIYFNDPFFIKFKVTLVNLIFSFVLFGGLYFKKPLLKSLMGTAIKLTDYGWIQLSKRWAYFFLFLAAANEIVYRNFSDAVWVNFKLFGIMGLTFIFIFSKHFLFKKTWPTTNYFFSFSTNSSISLHVTKAKTIRPPSNSIIGGFSPTPAHAQIGAKIGSNRMYKAARCGGI